MALASFLPPVPQEWLRPLWQYLFKRDGGPPTTAPSPRSIVTVDGTDTIAWDFKQAVGPDGLNADGFVVFVDPTDTTDPVATQYLVALDARTFSFTWGGAVTRSYAVAAYRTTYAGQDVGPKVQLGAWKGATGSATPDLSDYWKLGGRAGGQIGHGGTASGENATLIPNAADTTGLVALFDALLAYFMVNSNALVKLALGGDFTENFAPGGLWQQMIQADGIDPVLAMASFNGAGSQMQALAFTGSPAAPGAVVSGQGIFSVAGGVLDGDGNFIGPACGLAFSVQGDPGTGFAPTSLVFYTTLEFGGGTGQIEYDNIGLLRIPIPYTASQQYKVGGITFDHHEEAGSVGTGETDLFANTFQAHSLEQFQGIGAPDGGAKARIRCGGILVNSASTKRVRLYLGGTLLFDSGAMTSTAAGSWDLETLIMRVTDNNTNPPGFRATTRFLVAGATGGAVAQLTEWQMDPTVDNDWVLTGTAAGGAAADDDIVAKLATVEYLPIAER